METISGYNGDTGKTEFADSSWDLGHLKVGDVKSKEYSFSLPAGKSACEYFACACKAANELSGKHGYNQYTDNSNTFLWRVIDKCGGKASFPWNAIGVGDVKRSFGGGPYPKRLPGGLSKFDIMPRGGY